MEKEPFQLDYERYAINKTLRKIAKKYAVRKVLEVPAGGVKAMPSIYSLGFGEAGCYVTLVNPDTKGLKAWEDVNLRAEKVTTKKLNKLPLKDKSHDFVWNFNTLSLHDNHEEILEEMKRVSSKYVMILCVNGYNIGSPLHRTLHKVKEVEWTHGDKLFLFPGKVAKLMEKHGLKVVKKGVMNCPIWPDTVGFRDMKFHKMKKNFSKMDWDSNTLKFMKEKEYPGWIKAMYLFESIPMPLFIKHVYSHLFYVIGEKQ